MSALCKNGHRAYSIISSARTRSDGGTSRPRAFAVLRLTTVGPSKSTGQGIGPERKLCRKYLYLGPPSFIVFAAELSRRRDRLCVGDVALHAYWKSSWRERRLKVEPRRHSSD